MTNKHITLLRAKRIAIKNLLVKEKLRQEYRDREAKEDRVCSNIKCPVYDSQCEISHCCDKQIP